MHDELAMVKMVKLFNDLDITPSMCFDNHDKAAAILPQCRCPECDEFSWIGRFKYPANTTEYDCGHIANGTPENFIKIS